MSEHDVPFHDYNCPICAVDPGAEKTGMFGLPTPTGGSMSDQTTEVPELDEDVFSRPYANPFPEETYSETGEGEPSPFCDESCPVCHPGLYPEGEDPDENEEGNFAGPVLGRNLGVEDFLNLDFPVEPIHLYDLSGDLTDGPLPQDEGDKLSNAYEFINSLERLLDAADEEQDKLVDLANSLAAQIERVEEAAAVVLEQQRAYQERFSYTLHILRAIAVNGTPYTNSNRELALIALATVSAGDESFDDSLSSLTEGLR